MALNPATTPPLSNPEVVCTREDCALGKRRNEICPSPHRLSDGKNHWWSGWPGAYCLGCGCDDPRENCVGGNCDCACHQGFWDDVAVQEDEEMWRIAKAESENNERE